MLFHVAFNSPLSPRTFFARNAQLYILPHHLYQTPSGTGWTNTVSVVDTEPTHHGYWHRKLCKECWFPSQHTFTVTVCMYVRELVVLVTRITAYVTAVKPLLVNERIK